MKAAKLNRSTVIPDVVKAMKPAIGEMSRALAIAVEQHSNVAVQYLIDLGAHPGWTNWGHIRRTAIHFGAEANNPEALETIFGKWEGEQLDQFGPIIDLTSSRNRSPLTIASEHGFVEVVDVLLNYGAIPSANKEWDGRTPLHWATWDGHANLIDKLLAVNKGLLDLKTHGARTAISLVAERGHLDCVEKLTTYGADPTIPGLLGNSSLHWAVINNRPTPADHLTQRCLERYPQLLNQRNNKGESALWLAARKDKDDGKPLGTTLLNADADPYSEDNDTLTTLHATAISGSVQLMKYVR
jgi:ankyrin repeat protein